MWIAILDIVTEVFAAGLLSIMAGIIALLMGSYVVAAIILGTSVFITTLWMILFFLSSTRTFQVPKVIAKLVTKLVKEKGEKFVEQSNLWLEEICIMSRKNLKTKESNIVFLNAFALSIISWIFYGITFMTIATDTGYVINAFDSIMAVMAANDIGNLPITIGGSGLAEFGIVAYLNNLNPFDFSMAEGSVEWNTVIAWRIATYYVPIVITWFLLMKLALGKYTKADIK